MEQFTIELINSTFIRIMFVTPSILSLISISKARQQPQTKLLYVVETFPIVYNKPYQYIVAIQDLIHLHSSCDDVVESTTACGHFTI